MLKEQIIHDLTLHSGQPVSGQELADRYHVSRNAVWKAIQSLKENNIPIITVGRKGYALPAELDLITEAGIRDHLSPASASFPVLVFEEIDSTNAEARRRIANGDTVPALLVTGRQTSGRGHRGTSFDSPDNGLYLTLILHTELPAGQLLTVSKAAAAAACSSILDNCSVTLSIENVNDLHYNGTKIGGILTEAIVDDIESGNCGHCFTGIGLHLDVLNRLCNRSKIAADIANYLLSAPYRAPEKILSDYTRFHT
uniref:HTH domain-containing protein n=1 Tax=Eubacterium cellulosolvens TaxID=29322 RepID=UPI000683F915|nr:HTH domain-containing protein [[Eubacterium] cellulosolvens]